MTLEDIKSRLGYEQPQWRTEEIEYLLDRLEKAEAKIKRYEDDFRLLPRSQRNECDFK